LEQWKRVIIDNIEYDYEVSTLGNVRNVDTSRILKQKDNGNGYLKVGLYKNGKGKNFKVHRLVAIMFIPNPNNYDTVDHINHNKHDNRVENLRWLPLKENQSDGGKVTGQKYAKKVKCINQKTKEVKVFDSIQQASKETGLNQANIVSCCKGKRKTCGGYHWEYV
jgi:hypothetical protein